MTVINITDIINSAYGNCCLPVSEHITAAFTLIVVPDSKHRTAACIFESSRGHVSTPTTPWLQSVSLDSSPLHVT